MKSKIVSTITVLVFVAVLGLFSAAPSSGPIAYNSGNSSELVSTLDVTNGVQAQRNTVMFCILLPTAPVGGEVLAVTSELEVTDDLGYEVAVVSHLLLTDSCSTPDG